MREGHQGIGVPTDFVADVPRAEAINSRRVLLVDDEVAILRAYGKVLREQRWTVDPCSDARDAVEQLVRATTYDVIISDVTMPNMSGLEFLRAVRQRDLDVPVILMTGSPGIESAMEAIEYGAYRYLVKPVDHSLLAETALRASQHHEMARLKRSALEMVDAEHRIGDRAGLEARFASALDLFWIAHQPIVSMCLREVYGYEVLLRSNEPAFPHPGALLDAAGQLGKLPALGRAIRAKAASESANAPKDAWIFVNVHALDLNDRDLYSPDSPLAQIASRVVLEITERVSLEGVKNAATRIKDLRALGFRIAVDDLGAGYAGLSSFSQLEPEIAKIDMSLIRGIDADARKRSIVRSMTKLCEELGTLVVAEGIETTAERDTLVSLGCDLVQGYLFAKPQRGFPEPHW